MDGRPGGGTEAGLSGGEPTNGPCMIRLPLSKRIYLGNAMGKLRLYQINVRTIISVITCFMKVRVCSHFGMEIKLGYTGIISLETKKREQAGSVSSERSIRYIIITYMV